MQLSESRNLINTKMLCKLNDILFTVRSADAEDEQGSLFIQGD